MSGNWNIDWVRGVGIADAGWLALAAIALWLLLGEPLLGKRSYRALLAALDAGRADARVRFYRNWTLQGWLLMFAVLALAFGVLHWTPAHLGLRWPQVTFHAAGGFVAGMLGAAVAGLLFGIVMARRQAKSGNAPAKPAVAGDVLRMLPHCARERRGFALLSLTAGITEEVIWRGFLLAALVALFPHAPAWLLLVPMALVFGWAHLYQGKSGVLVTAILGAVLGGLYIGTGSLLLPIVLHAIIDLRTLLIPLPDDGLAGGRSTPD
jgi:membrane protease YdiL (CAAX protease family)